MNAEKGNLCNMFVRSVSLIPLVGRFDWDGYITITLLFAIDGVIALRYIRETKVVVFALCTNRS